MQINQVGGVRGDISEMLSKIREVSNKSNAFSSAAKVNETKSFNNVLNMVKDAVTNVSQSQVDTEKLKNSYITGDGNISMSQVIVSSQKSKLAFEGLVSVRNKILEAYKEIMNMPV